MTTYRHEPNGSRSEITPLLATWYWVGTRYSPFPCAWRAASEDGPECRMAYLAGVIARQFGVHLGG